MGVDFADGAGGHNGAGHAQHPHEQWRQSNHAEGQGEWCDAFHGEPDAQPDEGADGHADEEQDGGLADSVLEQVFVCLLYTSDAADDIALV